ncbi:uncharacterized protein BO96DRAFT_409021 [Aspergillus niger CBS 101883]|uniref:uncharacterized protein n=1 Tax=Aspergillus lacticoffeatus (strain CBS 101883) TaxID=1450533 RepID=UPI000D7F18C6|nr:uncharacterized protein BO96DRAFT_409021 [Aspergillus niger CBS 101883]PYH60895.1 hypothetical protein BO96DRAFT_409021 [Aspergillus niger CBS 101883]
MDSIKHLREVYSASLGLLASCYIEIFFVTVHNLVSIFFWYYISRRAFLATQNTTAARMIQP